MAIYEDIVKKNKKLMKEDGIKYNAGWIKIIPDGYIANPTLY